MNGYGQWSWQRRQVIVAQIVYWLWTIGAKGIIGCVYWVVISEGFRLVVPAAGKRLYKLPFLGFMEEYESLYRLDLANCMAVFLLVGVFTLWGSALRVYLGSDREFQVSRWRHTDNHKMLVVGLGIAIGVADMALFYAAMVQMTWGGSVFSLTALVATVAYVSILVVVTYTSINLKERVEEARREFENRSSI